MISPATAPDTKSFLIEKAIWLSVEQSLLASDTPQSTVECQSAIIFLLQCGPPRRRIHLSSALHMKISQGFEALEELRRQSPPRLAGPN